MTLLARHGDAEVHHAPWEDLIAVVEAAGGCDTLITDTPYSERTHAGHDDAVEQTRLAGEEKRLRVDKRNGSTYSVGINRRRLQYPCWSKTQVDEFVGAWSPRTRGWMVSMTDHVLWPHWEAALLKEGRYVFPPLAYVAPGSRVRLLGDGPSNWTIWLCVARPRTREFSTWGTLDGAHVLPAGQGGRMPVVGGKPVWLGTRIVQEYSRPGNLIVDPCCGSGVFGVAAIREGRRTILGDIDEVHAQIAAQWIANPRRPAPGSEEVPDPAAAQRPLFG